MSCQRDILVHAVADYALVLSVIREKYVLNLQVGADYLIVLSAKRTNMRVHVLKLYGT